MLGQPSVQSPLLVSNSGRQLPSPADLRLRVDIAILDFPSGQGRSQALQEVILSVDPLSDSSFVASALLISYMM